MTALEAVRGRIAHLEPALSRYPDLWRVFSHCFLNTLETTVEQTKGDTFVITGDIHRYAARLLPGGTMLLSGFYEDDIPVVRAAAESVGLQYVTFTECNRWVCLQLRQPCAE